MAARKTTLGCTPWDQLLGIRPPQRLPHGRDVAMVVDGKRCTTQEEVRAAMRVPAELPEGLNEDEREALALAQADALRIYHHLRTVRRECSNDRCRRSPEQLEKAAQRRQTPEYKAYKAAWFERNREHAKAYRRDYNNRRKLLDPTFRDEEKRRKREADAAQREARSAQAAQAAQREGGAA